MDTYEKKYKDALERAKQLHTEDGSVESRDTCEGLDEAAVRYERERPYNDFVSESIKLAFKAGAKWAMEQGKTFVCHTEGNVCDDEEFYWFPVNQIWQYVRWELPLNKEFIVQIRKKD